MHHAYIGGLLEHTLALVRLADSVSGRYPSLDRSLLICGAMLHDIGKIGIRDAILNKPGKLSTDEWREMKLHPLIGAKIIRPLSFLNEVTDIVEQEHERWDGKGYPFGLKGNEIRLGARIVSIADAYDAITSDRPYHKAQTHEWAAAEINRCSGTQFDPKVVEAFNLALEHGIPGINRPLVPSEDDADLKNSRSSAAA